MNSVSPQELDIAVGNAGSVSALLIRPEKARAVWREALEIYRDQGRDQDADRVQRQLDALDHRGD